MGFMRYPYLTLEDKHKFVDPIAFTTLDDLVRQLEELHDGGYFVRGQKNALWPIFSSGARNYLNYTGGTPSKIDFLDFLSKALLFVKQKSSILPNPKTEPSRIKCYDHEIWGWLQHYSFPTPFIDFTHDPFVALYMAVRDIASHLSKDGVSIYAMRGDYAEGDNEVVSLEKQIADNKVLLHVCGLSNEQMFGFDNWKNFSFFIIHKDGRFKPWAKELAAERIASQKGLFVYLNTPEKPMEQYFEQQNKIRSGKCEDGQGCFLPRLKCFDISSRLIPEIQKYCKDKGYAEKALGLSDQSIDKEMQRLFADFIQSIQISN